ncbi:MAG: phage head closure protein [Alphaproteobacteria bacterium]
MFANAEPLTNLKFVNEIYLAMQMINKEYWIFTIRKMDNMRSKMQIKYNEKIFEVKRVYELDNFLNIIALLEDER